METVRRRITQAYMAPLAYSSGRMLPARPIGFCKPNFIGTLLVALREHRLGRRGWALENRDLTPMLVRTCTRTESTSTSSAVKLLGVWLTNSGGASHTILVFFIGFQYPLAVGTFRVLMCTHEGFLCTLALTRR